MKNLIQPRKRVKMNLSESSIIILSDSDESEDAEVRIDKSDVIDDSRIETVTLDDSKVNQSEVTFTLDTTPDFIPLTNVLYNKPKRGRKRRLGASPEIVCLKKRKWLPEQIITSAENVKTCNRYARKNEKSKVTRAKSKLTVEPKANKFENDATKPKIPQIQLSHTNIHNIADTPRLAGGLRPIIIDGCNVAFAFGNGKFQYEGIISVVEYFKERGHKEIVCFLPQCYRNKFRPQDVNNQFKEFEKENIITYTPSRYLNGQLIKPYDDRFIVQYASAREGVIISNDGYLDLINEESSWRSTIEERIVNFTFARGLLMLPKDPLGPNGPTLDEMLKF